MHAMRLCSQSDTASRSCRIIIIIKLILSLSSLLLISSQVPTTVVAIKCPQNSTINPCRCYDDQRIICDGEYDFNLKSIFNKINDNLTNTADTNDDPIFEEFVLNNTEISELSDDLFGNAKFKRIRLIDCLSLRKISRNAFIKSGDKVEEFIVSGESSLGEDQYSSDLFDALNSMVNADKIWLNRNRLRSIPTVAFGKKPFESFKLKDLNFNKFSSKNGHIRSVGNFAFYYLNQLEYLYLSHQRINYLPRNAFDFEKPSNQTLYIYLGNNKLNNTSFQKGVFLNSKRPIHLALYWNHELTHLDETVFVPFLEQNPLNRISLQDNPLICDCNSYWIVREREKYRKQLLNIMCKIGPKQTFNIDLISFDKCANKNRRRNKLLVIN